MRFSVLCHINWLFGIWNADAASAFDICRIRSGFLIIMDSVSETRADEASAFHL